jgi:hypothetical protein
LHSKNFILQKLSPFKNYKKVITTDQSTKDIVNGIIDTHYKWDSEYDKISQYFVGADVEETAKNVWEFLKNNVPYYIESSNNQTLRSPAAIVSMPGDCKSYSLFINGVFSSLARKGIMKVPYAFRFASYKEGIKEPGHVFSVLYPGTKNEIWIDPVLDRFNDKSKQPTFFKDKNSKMSLIALSGVENNYSAKAKFDEMSAYRDQLVRDRDMLLNSGKIKSGGSKELEYKVAINKVTRALQNMPQINGFFDNFFGGSQNEGSQTNLSQNLKSTGQGLLQNAGSNILMQGGTAVLNALLTKEGVTPDFFSQFPFLTAFDNSTFKWKSRLPLLAKMSPNQRVAFYIQKMQDNAEFEDAPQQYFELFGRASGTKSGFSDVGQVSRDVAQLFNDTLNQKYFQGKSVFNVRGTPRNRTDYSINTLISKAPLSSETGGSGTQKAGMNIGITLGLVAGAFLLIRQFGKK